MDDDRDFVFAASSLRQGLIDAEAFTEVCAKWAASPTASLADAVTERARLSPADRDRLLRTAERGDAAETVADAPRPPDQGHETEPYIPGSGNGSPCYRLSPSSASRYEKVGDPRRGGIGQVWRARDARLGRTVALKELKPKHLRIKNLRARFLAEAQITSQLGHPSIVPVYDLEEDDGRGDGPFYTMPFIEGRTLAEACRDCRTAGAPRLEMLELLSAFVSVCNAIAHAHSRGVVHRDLKGANIVLGEFGEVMVIDWGLAKVTDADGLAVDSAVHTESGDHHEHVTLTPGSDRGDTAPGSPIGTPTNMPPESAAGRVKAIGKPSDVYGLGTVLYEVLTGRPPFHGPDAAATLDQARRADPPRPRSLNPNAPRALEAVCRKAMEREPADRYASASDLAADVRRYLADEPVTAYPDPWPARLGRWARHHKSWVAAGAALLMAAVLGLGVFAGLTERQRLNLVAANAKTENARREAEANFRTAVEAVEGLLTPLFDKQLANVPQAEPVRRQVAREASRYAKAFVRLKPDDPSILHTASKVFRREANVERQLGNHAAAQEGYERALGLLETLHGKFPQESMYQDQLAETESDAAEALRMQGRPREAERVFLRAQSRAVDLRAARPDAPAYRRTEARVLSDLGAVLIDQGRYSEAEPLLARAVELWRDSVAGPKPGPSDPLLLILALANLTEVRRLAGPPGAAEPIWTEAVASARASVRARDDNDRRYVLSAALFEAGVALEAVPGRTKEALAMLDEAVDLRRGLVRGFPWTPHYRQRYAQALEVRGKVRLAAGSTAEARADWEAARPVAETLVKDNTGSFIDHALLGAVLGDLGRLALDQSDHVEALKLLDAALAEDALALSRDPAIAAPAAARLRHLDDRARAAPAR